MLGHLCGGWDRNVPTPMIADSYGPFFYFIRSCTLASGDRAPSLMSGITLPMINKEVLLLLRTGAL